MLLDVSIEHRVRFACLRRFCADPVHFSRNRGIPESVVVRVKARAVKNKRWQRLDPAGGRWGLFGLHTVPESAKEVVLTEVRWLMSAPLLLPFARGVGFVLVRSLSRV